MRMSPFTQAGRARNTSGQSLVAALLVLLFLTSMMGLVATVFMIEARAARNQYHSLAGSYIARAGVESALNQLLADDRETDSGVDGWHNNPDAFWQKKLGGGIFEVAYKDSATGIVRPGIVDEERRINLNHAGAETLKRLHSAFTDEIVSAVNAQVRAQGKIISVGQIADRASGTYELRARISNPDGRFTGGMVVIARTTTKASHQAIRIPVTALCRAYGQPPYVLLVEPDNSQAVGRVVAREVELGPMAGDRVEVSGGLSDNELLIIRGQDRVVEGDRVEYQRAAPASVGRIRRPLP